ncbi:MAG: O-methyltransferase [Pyrinomonadaceae bacterium]
MSRIQPEILAVIEEALANHRPFGESEYITDQMEVSYTRRLDGIAPRLPGAGELLLTLEHTNDDVRHRLFGNTVVRCAIQHARSQIEADMLYGLPLAECENVFAAAQAHISSGKAGMPLENGPVPLRRLGSAPCHGWIWTEEHADDIFGRSFRYLIKQNYGDRLSSPTDDEIETLSDGARLLETLLPTLGPSAMRHAHLIACFPEFGSWRGKQSSSQYRIGGTIFLGRRLLNSAWWVAEHLFHESLHQKLYDFRHGHSVIEPRPADKAPVRVCSPWNAEKLIKANDWDTHRVLAAFHVYVHLSLLSMLAEERAAELEAEFGPKLGMIESRKALDRARYLGEQLKNECWDELGLAGKSLVDWLISVLDALDPSPAPAGAYVHLVLDLYLREATEAESALNSGRPVHENLASQLTPLAKEEVERTRTVLSAISADHALERFNASVAQYSDTALGAKFPDVRRTIVRTLLDSSIDGYRLPPNGPTAGDPNERVREMVEQSSEHLHVILAGVPRVVAAAKQRAKELCYGKSCRDTVGRLLATLAAAVPQGGRILEIGTGVGAGTAWICEGLGERTDVEVISVEVDARRSNATRKWPWPAHVQLLNADILEVLAELGTFNLVFADASPIKFSHIEPVIGALRQRGMLVIDDLEPSMVDSEALRAEVNGLRRHLLHHPKLQAADLDWSSGVIITTCTYGAS